MHRGQAMLEYILVLTALVTLVSVMGWVIVAAERHESRAVHLVRSDYP